jgi:hypothetical protein
MRRRRPAESVHDHFVRASVCIDQGIDDALPSQA